MSMAKLIDWNENCKDNVIFNPDNENNSSNNIGNILSTINSNTITNNDNNEKLLQNFELQKLILNRWKKLHDDIKIFNMNLFHNIKLNNGSLLPLRHLCLGEENTINNIYNRIIISFDSNAFLGPQASLRFYADK